ncbi:MAG: serine hydrolase [Chloroflexota bacterium]|nr:serine hydrolase [Chloroflexota bacterium]
MHSPHDDETDQTPRHTKHSARRHDVEPRYRPTHPYYYARSYNDEHPEIPRVKRASLQVGGDDVPPLSTEKVRRATKKASPAEARSQRLERERRGTASPSVAPRSERSPYRQPPTERARYIANLPTEAATDRMRRVSTSAEDDFFAGFDEHTEQTEAAPHTASRIMVTQRRRPSISTVYEPLPSIAHRARNRRQYNPFVASLQRLSHKRSFMIVASVIIIMLIVLPILANVIAHTRDEVVTLTGSGSSSSSSVNQAGVAHPGASAHSTTVDGILVTPTDLDHPAPPVLATSAYLLDADTGATLYASNPNMHLPMMSTTKLMTAVLAVEKGNPDQKITINDAISNDINQLSADSSVMGIKKGETYTLRDLLYGLLLMSGNDAAIAIADGISGNLPAFVALMNQRANQLGLHNTHYMNPHGLLDPNHYSSAHDLALLGKFSMSIPLIHQISGTKNYTISQSPDHAEHAMFNGDQFLWWYPSVDGGKPGWDGAQNFVQVISCTRNNHHLIGVTMHTSDWWTDMRDLMNWGFGTFQWVSPRIADQASGVPYDTDWNYFARDQQSNTLPTADHGRYYIFTGYSISGAILTYFDKNGGLQKFGYPTGLPKTVTSTMLKQQFEHATIQCDLANQHCSTV